MRERLAFFILLALSQGACSLLSRPFTCEGDGGLRCEGDTLFTCEEGLLFEVPCGEAAGCVSAQGVAACGACGDRLLQGDLGELCDNGDQNSNTTPDACRLDCQPPRCGDSVDDTADECDDANQTNGDGCDNNCTTTACGNGIPAGSEGCDDGNAINGDGCDNNCTTTACGNGIPTTNEGCDDGNNIPLDGCDTDCVLELCGDGVTNNDGQEECDDGNPDNGDGCEADCTFSCGNGIIEPTLNEECDDGNNTPLDGCEADCTFSCGSGINADGSFFDLTSQHCYLGFNTLLDWNAARADCNTKGGHIVSITSAAENDIVQTQLNLTSNRWIGLNDLVTEAANNARIFVWDSQEPRLFLNFASAQPDNSGNQDCVRLAANNGQWDDISCTTTLAYVCEIETPTCGNGFIEIGERCDDGNSTNGDGCEDDCTLSCGNSPTAILSALDPLTDHCYLGFSSGIVWQSAESSCENLGGYLAVIDDQAENTLARSASLTLDAPWIGFNDISAEANNDPFGFIKITGGNLTFDGFSSTEPNNQNGTEDCVHFFGATGDPNTWNDAICANSNLPLGFICEIEPAHCGDGVKQTNFAEECDDGDLIDGDGCEADCTFTCGSGILVAGRFFDPVSQHCYLGFSAGLNFDSAQSDCANKGGHLATISSSAEDDIVRNQVGLTAGRWIGLNDKAIEAQTNPNIFAWVTQEPLLFQDFGFFQPDDFNNEDCVEMRAISNDWNDLSCVAVRDYVCEIETPTCGNGFIEPGEDCDDGNTQGGDGCEDDCQLLCGDGVITLGEACDDSNNITGDGCRADCSQEACGDAILDPSEGCDDGEHCQDGTPCTQDTECTAIGDGLCVPRSLDGCKSDCSLPPCGDNIFEPGELCFPATPASIAVGNQPHGVAAGDLDGDADLDLVTANFGADNISVLLNNGNGVFAAPTSITAGDGPDEVDLGDLDGDADLDIAVVNAIGDSVSVFLNQGALTFSAQIVTVGNQPVALDIADLDGDADLDIATANFSENSVSVILNGGNGAFGGSTNRTAGSGTVSVRAGDFDGDADLDLVTAHTAVDTIGVFFNQNNTNFSSVATTAAGNGPDSVAVADFDGDADLDLAINNDAGANVSIFKNSGTGQFSVFFTATVGTNPEEITEGDLDNDGDLDLVTANRSGNSLSLVLNNGLTQFVTALTITLANNPQGLTLADLDQDGALDIIAVTESNAQLHIFLANP